MAKVCIIDGSVGYRNLFQRMGHEIVHKLEDAHLVCFTGGEDVTPSYYGADKHPFTNNNPVRDRREKEAFEICVSMRIPMVGICRGAQFLNVMCGGEMYQHVTNHCGDHQLIDLDTKEVVEVSSTHHQMMKPSDNAIIIATAKQNSIREWYEGDKFFSELSEEDYEVVAYPEQGVLCFQPHPEFMGYKYEGMYEYFKSLVDDYLLELSS